MKQKLYNFALIYGFIAVIFIPASFKISSFQLSFTKLCFGWLSDDVAKFSSDSQSLLLLFIVLLGVAILVQFILTPTKFWLSNQAQIRRFLHWILVYYLASRIAVYGFDKLVKSQFFMPEPNTLYTPVGLLTKDILYWTSMGTSYWFNIMTGCLELLAAGMLLYKKTRVLGLLLTLSILINVLIINFGFDISVKMYSLFLILIVLVLLSPNFFQMFLFFKGEKAQLKPESASFAIFNKPFVKSSLKSFVIGMIVLDMSFFVLQTGNFNDDLAERPYLHGAYELESNPFGIKRCFIHRRDFFILQYQDERLEDFALTINETNLLLKDYNGEVNKVPFRMYNNVLDLNYKGVLLTGFALDWRSLPALQDDFHFYVNPD